MKTKLSLILATVALLFVVGWNGYGQKQSSSTQRWEYMTVLAQNSYLDDKKLNELGEQGWELVSATTNCYSGSGTTSCYAVGYFKRTK